MNRIIVISSAGSPEELMNLYQTHEAILTVFWLWILCRQTSLTTRDAISAAIVPAVFVKVLTDLVIWSFLFSCEIQHAIKIGRGTREGRNAVW